MNLVLHSIVLNYKMWISFFVALYLIDSKNIIQSFFTLFMCMIAIHNIHYLIHLDWVYPFNIPHIYHHNHNNWLSHIIEILIEFFFILLIIVVKHLYNFIYTIESNLFSDWIVVFFYIYYTTGHNINYSIFHVNRIHETHHKLLVKNLGPDIIDVIFGTKFNPEHDIENTDHTIPNIILALIVVLCLRPLAKYRWFGYLFGFTYGIVVCILIVTSAYIFLKEAREYLDRDLERFISV